MTEEQKESSWNMAKAYLQRMDLILQRMDLYSFKQDYYKWFLSCVSLYREIYPKLIKEDKKKHDERMNLLIEKCNTAKEQNERLPINYTDISPELSQWDFELRVSMEKLDLISPSKRDQRFSFK